MFQEGTKMDRIESLWVDMGMTPILVSLLGIGVGVLIVLMILRGRRNRRRR